jgi:hypothetical protein
MIYKFTNEAGESTVVSSTVPGVLIVPSGFTMDDSVPVTQEEYQAHLDAIPVVTTTQPSVADLQAQIDELKTLITKQIKA